MDYRLVAQGLALPALALALAIISSVSRHGAARPTADHRHRLTTPPVAGRPAHLDYEPVDPDTHNASLASWVYILTALYPSLVFIAQLLVLVLLLTWRLELPVRRIPTDQLPLRPLADAAACAFFICAPVQLVFVMLTIIYALMQASAKAMVIGASIFLLGSAACVLLDQVTGLSSWYFD